MNAGGNLEAAISDDHKKVLDTNRHILVENIDIEDIADELRYHEAISTIMYQQVKLPTNTQTEHTQNYIKHLKKRKEKDYFAFLHVLKLKVPAVFSKCKCFIIFLSNNK